MEEKSRVMDEFTKSPGVTKDVETYRTIQKTIAGLENILKYMRDGFVKKLNRYGLKDFENELVKITHFPETEKTIINLEEFQKKEPEEYKGILEDYPYTYKTAEYTEVIVKEQK